MPGTRIQNRSSGKMSREEAARLRKMNYDWWASRQKNPPPMEEIDNERDS